MPEPPVIDPAPSWMSGALRALTHACTRRPRLTLIVIAVSIAVCVGFTVQHLRFKTDRSDLIDPSTPFQQRWLKYTQSFGEASDMIVVIEAERPETIKQAQDDLGSKLRAQPQLFGNVLYKVEPGTLRHKGLQYLAPEALVAGLERLDDFRPVLQGRWDLVQLETLIPLLRFQWQDLAAKGIANHQALAEHALRLSESLARFAEDPNDFVNPWPEIVPVDPKLRDRANETVYFLNEAGTMGFIMTTPVAQEDSFQGATKAIDTLRQLMAETRSEIPGVRIALTGIPVLENDEMRRSQDDSTKASVISYFAVAGLLFLGFRGIMHPLLGMVMLIVSMAWAFGYTTLAVGHLNILSVSFVAMLIGLGIDFAIHVLSKYLELRHEGRELRHALVDTAGSIGPGIVTGAITTALAFFCATLTEFLGVAELGIIAAGGIMLCALAAFTSLPAMIALVDRRRQLETLPVPFQGRWLRSGLQRYPLRLLTISTATMLALLGWGCDWSQGWPVPRVVYDHNLLHLQAEGLESVDAQKRIFDASNNSLLYAISLADSVEEARQLKARFEALPTVRHVEDLASRLPEHPATETKLFVQAFHALLARLPAQPPMPTPSNPGDLGRGLDGFCEFLKTQPDPAARTISRHLDRFLDRLDTLDTPEQVRMLTEYQYRLAYSLLAQFQALAAASDPEPVTADDLTPELRVRYVSPQGQWLLQVFPKDPVWDMEPLEQFVKDVRTVDPEVTGTPLQNFEAALQIKESYEICAIYALLVIVVVLLMDFMPKDRLVPTFFPPLVVATIVWGLLALRDVPVPPVAVASAFTVATLSLACWWDRGGVVDTLLALMPPLLGMLLTLGLLPVFGIPLNPANLIILPLILGIGVDNGVHVLHDYHRQPNEPYTPSASIVNAIMLTSATTMVGFGSMMIAAHRGLYSLGAVLTIGVASCLFVSLVPLPACLAWLSRHRGQHRRRDSQESGESTAAIPQAGESDADDLPITLPLPRAMGITAARPSGVAPHDGLSNGSLATHTGGPHSVGGPPLTAEKRTAAQG